MAASDIYQITSVYLVNTEPSANVFYIKVLDDDGTTDAMKDAVDALDDYVLKEFRDMQTTQVEYECLLARRVHPTTCPARVFSISSTGAISADTLPANQPLVLRHYSGDGSIRKRGRYFISGLAETACNHGAWEFAVKALVDPLMTVLNNTITSSGMTYRMQHFSKKNEQWYDIDSCTFNPIPTKLRGRTPSKCSIG